MNSVLRNLTMVVLSVGAIAIATHANAQTTSEQTLSETVFVMTNAADRNQVISYQKERNGSFREQRRFATGGRGSGGQIDPLQSQGSLSFNDDHTLLFAANAGSGTVSVFRVRGPFLALVDRVDSGGSEPLAIAASGNNVYVLNGAAAGNVVAFRLDPVGHLHQIQNSTRFLSSTNAGGSSISVSPDHRFLAVTERLTNSIDTFPIHANGTLGSIVTNASSAPGVFSAAFAPDGNLLVSETGPSGVVNGSTISSYAITSSGAISVVSQSVPTFGSANCWNAITPNGKWVYTSNAASGTISGFAIGKEGALAPIGSTVLATNPQGSANLDIAISSDGKYLYALDAGTGAISVFAVQSDGTLNSLSAIEGLPAAAGFNGIAAL